MFALNQQNDASGDTLFLDDVPHFLSGQKQVHGDQSGRRANMFVSVQTIDVKMQREKKGAPSGHPFLSSHFLWRFNI